jgi:hypothetical protein
VLSRSRQLCLGQLTRAVLEHLTLESGNDSPTALTKGSACLMMTDLPDGPCTAGHCTQHSTAQQARVQAHLQAERLDGTAKMGQHPDITALNESCTACCGGNLWVPGMLYLDATYPDTHH